MTARDSYAVRLNDLLARRPVGVSYAEAKEREQDEADAAVENAIREVARLSALMDRPRPLVRSRL